MKAGILGLPTDGRLESVEPLRSTVLAEETPEQIELVRQLTPDETVQTHLGGSDARVVTGLALHEEAEKVEKYNATEDGIEAYETTERIQTCTEFAAVPATDSHDGFVLAGSSAGTFVFDYLGRANGCMIQRAELDLRGYYRDHKDAIVHRYGWESIVGEADTGVTWSDADVRDDEDFSRFLDATDPTPTQLGMSYTDELLRLVLAESGYIEVYSPSEMETTEFIERVVADVLPHARAAEDDT